MIDAALLITYTIILVAVTTIVGTAGGAIHRHEGPRQDTLPLAPMLWYMLGGAAISATLAVIITIIAVLARS